MCVRRVPPLVSGAPTPAEFQGALRGDRLKPAARADGGNGPGTGRAETRAAASTGPPPPPAVLARRSVSLLSCGPQGGSEPAGSGRAERQAGAPRPLRAAGGWSGGPTGGTGVPLRRSVAGAAAFRRTLAAERGLLALPRAAAAPIFSLLRPPPAFTRQAAETRDNKPEIRTPPRNRPPGAHVRRHCPGERGDQDGQRATSTQAPDVRVVPRPPQPHGLGLGRPPSDPPPRRDAAALTVCDRGGGPKKRSVAAPGPGATAATEAIVPTSTAAALALGFGRRRRRVEEKVPDPLGAEGAHGHSLRRRDWSCGAKHTVDVWPRAAGGALAGAAPPLQHFAPLGGRADGRFPLFPQGRSSAVLRACRHTGHHTRVDDHPNEHNPLLREPLPTL